MGNYQKTAVVSITRATNTTPYAAGDVINGDGSTSALPITFNMQSGENAWIVGGQATSSVAQNTLNMDALFFSIDVSPIAADNAPFDPSDGNLKDYYLGRISFSSFLSLASNSIGDGLPASTKPIIITPQTTIVYVVLVARAAYTPGSGEIIGVRFDFAPAD